MALRVGNKWRRAFLVILQITVYFCRYRTLFTCNINAKIKHCNLHDFEVDTKCIITLLCNDCKEAVVWHANRLQKESKHWHSPLCVIRDMSRHAGVTGLSVCGNDLSQTKHRICHQSSAGSGMFNCSPPPPSCLFLSLTVSFSTPFPYTSPYPWSSHLIHLFFHCYASVHPNTTGAFFFFVMYIMVSQ